MGQQYACGGWNSRHDIPSGASGVTQFSVLSDANELICRSALETSKDPAVGKVTAFYESCNDLSTRNAVSRSAFHTQIIVPAEQPFVFEEQLAAYQQSNVMPLFATYVSSDDKNASRNVARLNQGGLGLPSRDYYINKTASSDPVLRAYRSFIEFGLQWLGNYTTEELAAASQAIVDFETTLAEFTVPAVWLFVLFLPFVALVLPFIAMDGLFRARNHTLFVCLRSSLSRLSCVILRQCTTR